MSRQSVASNVKAGLEHAVADIVFLPSPNQRQTKAAFWLAQRDNPLADVESVTLAYALQLTGDTRLEKWWSDESFRAWFLNKDEFRQRLEYLSQLALDTAEEILLDRGANPSARVNMAKIVIEAAAKQREAEAGELEKLLDGMDEKDLVKLLGRLAPKLLGQNSKEGTPNGENLAG